MVTFNNFVTELKNQKVKVIVEDIFHEYGSFIDDPIMRKAIYLSPLQPKEEMIVSLVHETVHYLQTLSKGKYLVGNKLLREYNPSLTPKQLKEVHRHILQYPKDAWETEKAAFALQYYPEKVWELLIQ